MRLSAAFPLAILLWFAAEAFAFSLVAGAVGFVGALFLCLLTSLIGIGLLRRLGLATAWRLRRAMASRPADETELTRAALVDGGLVAIGSILLILPGFVSDFCGLALAAPSVRAWLCGKFGNRRGRGGDPGLVELEPGEWTRMDPSDGGGPPARPGPAKFGPTRSQS